MAGASGDEDVEATQVGEDTGAEVVPSIPIASALQRGETAGRYVILDGLGTGGMGVVYAAYDPELDRKVALKVVRADRRDAEQRGRLLREAQALARLRHPNVVAVHDVGLIEDEVFVAMEFVAGQTLAQWRRASPRSWREILAVMSPAGRGVAAAHAAGLVHRDLKPDNVMVREDGSACVMDFGLARADGEGTPAPPAAAASAAALRTDLTTTGAVMGTPAYMSPEQHRGAAADPRTDQFSFCVVLYELLYGERPFAGDNAAGIASAVTMGRMRDAPAKTSVPGWLRAVVLRGLAVRQDDRYPTMEALLVALERDPTRTRRKWVLAAVAGAVVLAVPAVVLVQRDRQRRQCAESGARIDEVWNDSERQRLRERLMAVRTKGVEDTIERASSRLDAHADQWRDAATELCRRERIVRDFSPELVPHAQACLEDSRLGFAGLIQVLGDIESAEPSAAVTAAANLDPVTHCVDPAWLELHPFPILTGAAQETAQELRGGLARVNALDRTSRFAEAAALLDELAHTADSLGDEGLLARVQLERGSVAHGLGDLDAAETGLRRAFLLGVRSGQVETAARAAIEMIYLEGIDRERFDMAMVWNDVAIALGESLGDRDGLLTSERLTNLAGVHWGLNDLDAAAEAIERSAEMKRAVLGPDHPALAGTLSNLGLVLRRRGDHPRALEHYSEAIVILESSLGPRSPSLAVALNNKGYVYLGDERFAEAGECFERALAIYEETLGPEHPDTAMALHNLAMVRRGTGDIDTAIALFERALAIRRQKRVAARGVASTAILLAQLLVESGRDRERALALAREAREIVEGSDDPDKDAGIAEIDAWLAEQARPVDPRASSSK